MSKNKFESKREREKQTVALMIRLYCKKKHGTKKTLCPECDTPRHRKQKGKKETRT